MRAVLLGARARGQALLRELRVQRVVLPTRVAMVVLHSRSDAVGPKRDLLVLIGRALRQITDQFAEVAVLLLQLLLQLLGLLSQIGRDATAH